MSAKVLVLPGWQGNGLRQWPLRWAAQYGYTVVEQNDGQWPRRGDWLARLDEVVVDTPGAGADLVLVADGLACIQVAAWASVSRHTARIRAAWLAAPLDVEHADMPVRLPGWAPIVRERLPFAAMVVGPHNDPLCSQSRARQWAQDWGAQWVDAENDVADWPEGHALLQGWLKPQGQAVCPA